MKQFTRYELHKELELIWYLWASLLSALLVILPSCSTTKKTAEQKVLEEKQKRIELLKEVRQQFPCDSSTKYITQTDTAFITLVPDTVTIDGVKYVTKDRVITKTVEKLVTVVDRAQVQQMRDSIDNLIYTNGQITDSYNKYIKDTDTKIAKQDNEISSLKPWKKSVLWTGGILAAGGLVFGIFKLKSIFL
jgi:hypothetical protein